MCVAFWVCFWFGGGCSGFFLNRGYHSFFNEVPLNKVNRSLWGLKSHRKDSVFLKAILIMLNMAVIQVCLIIHLGPSLEIGLTSCTDSWYSWLPNCGVGTYCYLVCECLKSLIDTLQAWRKLALFPPPVSRQMFSLPFLQFLTFFSPPLSPL